MIVYKVVNKINHMCYVGKTTYSLGKRKIEHNSNLLNPHTYFHKALRKYGADNFKWNIVAECNNSLILNELEKFYIDYFKSILPNGYNLTYGGEGAIHCEATKKKLSFAKLGKKNPMWGKHLSLEAKKLKAEIWKGRKHTEESKRKMSKNRKGIIFSDEHRRNLSISHKGKKLSECQRNRISFALSGKKRKPFSEEHKKNLSIAHKGIQVGLNNPMYGKKGNLSPNWGKHLSDETKEKIRLSHIGKKASKETKLKQSLARKNYLLNLR